MNKYGRKQLEKERQDATKAMELLKEVGFSVRTVDEFYSREEANPANGIWIGDYHTDEAHVLLFNSFRMLQGATIEEWLEAKGCPGWFSEPYDAGTMMLYRQ